MAEQERLTNKERRAKAREERKRKEAEAAQKRRRAAIRNGLVAAAVFGVVAAVVLQAVLGGDASLDEAVLVGSEDIEQAEQAAGCETFVEREPLEEAGHFERNQAPPADLIYPDIRPTHSGPHTSQTFPPVPRGASEQIDEKTSTHNLEHGAIIVWYDPEQVEDDTIDEMGAWAETLNNSGFNTQGGALIYVSPYEDPGISSGQAIALRAWGTAVDCDEWDETVGNGFVARHYGTRGIGPEAQIFATYPDGVLEISDEETPEAEPEDVDTDESHETEDGLLGGDDDDDDADTDD